MTDSYPEANARHYQFTLEGLTDAQAVLKQRGMRRPPSRWMVFAKALLVATPEKQLAEPRRKRPDGKPSVNADQLARMERELASLQMQVKSVEDTYGIDTLHLTVAKGYVAKLLANARVMRWLTANRQEYISELQSIAGVEDLATMPVAAE